ncbi:hypothetical protein SteCoe_22568 [Stentor coeruleus]|uniref:ATP synthase mitochondrial F1 complex assembly factor 1 n=1 Tax=Stentor coeruleus TaxID=5963 RepID=A0A1R2BMJ1_9CILI|nr:hypothetical protein SteCoe_22568 [Stentor coeruleus]
MKLRQILTARYSCDLETVMKTEPFKNKSATTVIDVWNYYHRVLPEAVSLAMSYQKTKLLQDRMSKMPIFMQPVIRDLNHFFLLSHISEGKELIMFNFVEDINVKPLEYDPIFIMRIFKEMYNSHGIFLVRGDIIDKAISKTEAELAMKGLINYYTDNNLYKEYIEPFNERLADFNHEKFLNDYLETFSRKEDKFNDF